MDCDVTFLVYRCIHAAVYDSNRGSVHDSAGGVIAERQTAVICTKRWYEGSAGIEATVVEHLGHVKAPSSVGHSNL